MPSDDVVVEVALAHVLVVNERGNLLGPVVACHGGVLFLIEATLRCLTELGGKARASHVAVRVLVQGLNVALDVRLESVERIARLGLGRLSV